MEENKLDDFVVSGLFAKLYKIRENNGDENEIIYSKYYKLVMSIIDDLYLNILPQENSEKISSLKAISKNKQQARLS